MFMSVESGLMCKYKVREAHLTGYGKQFGTVKALSDGSSNFL